MSSSGTDINPFGNAANRQSLEAIGGQWGMTPAQVDQAAIKNANANFGSTGELFTAGTPWMNVMDQTLHGMADMSGHQYAGLSQDQINSNLDTANHVQRNFNDTVRSYQDATDWQQGAYIGSIAMGALGAFAGGGAAAAGEAGAIGADTGLAAASVGDAATIGAETGLASTAGGAPLAADAAMGSSGLTAGTVGGTAGASAGIEGLGAFGMKAGTMLAGPVFGASQKAQIALNAASGAYNNSSNTASTPDTSSNIDMANGAITQDNFVNNNPMADGAPLNWNNTYASLNTGTMTDANPETTAPTQGTPMTEGDVVDLSNSGTSMPAQDNLQGLDFSQLGMGGGMPGTNSLNDLISGASAGDTVQNVPDDTSSVGNDLLDFTNKWLGGPKNVGATALQMYMFEQLQRQATANINAQKQTSALDQSQRTPYQNAAAQLQTTQGAADFIKNNPEADAINQRFRDFVIPRGIAQSGNVGNTLDTAGSQYVGQLANIFGTQMSQDLMAGGFTNAPSNYLPASIGTQGNNQAIASMGQIAALGKLLGMNAGAPASGTAGNTGNAQIY
jgi:hypothetical protein